MSIMIIEISPGLELYRYDINEPGPAWNSIEHSLKTEHSYEASVGPKNKIGAYYLYDNIKTTNAVAFIACNKKALEKYWLSNTKSIANLRIIDFSKCSCIHEMLDVLESLKINVCIPEFKINGMDRNLTELIGHNYDSRIHPTLPNLIEVGYLGQLLTDFNNGILFMGLLKKSGLIVDGYRFCEELNPYGLTYCLFNADKLSIPNKHLVNL